jgi:crotonobetainyl-CoA:carnitine CoA-transferase CaiB-like acyl-CoA transferase
MAAANALHTGVSPVAKGEMLNGGNPTYNYFETKDRRYLSVGSLEPQFAIAFLDTIKRPQWLERLAGSVLAGDGDGESLRADIASVIAERTLEEWMSVFDGSDCCVEPVLTITEATRHPLFVERGMVMDVLVGDNVVKQVSPPIKFRAQAEGGEGRTGEAMAVGGGQVGENTERVLRTELGLSDRQIEELKSNGCI